MDADYLKKCQHELDSLTDLDKNKKLPEQDPNADKSMSELFRAKRQATQKKIEENSMLPESVEDRTARLKAQRDFLMKQKKAEREQELIDFNKKVESTDNDNDLFEEFKRMDTNKKPGQAALANANSQGMSDLERRRMIFKKVRADIQKDDDQNREINYKRKMTELEKREQDQAKSL